MSNILPHNATKEGVTLTQKQVDFIRDRLRTIDDAVGNNRYVSEAVEEIEGLLDDGQMEWPRQMQVRLSVYNNGKRVRKMCQTQLETVWRTVAAQETRYHMTYRYTKHGAYRTHEFPATRLGVHIFRCRIDLVDGYPKEP